MPISAGTARRNARPHASATTAGLLAPFTRVHSEGVAVGLRRFGVGFGLTVSRDDAGGSPGPSSRGPRRDRSMLRKYAWCDHSGNFLTAFLVVVVRDLDEVRISTLANGIWREIVRSSVLD